MNMTNNEQVILHAYEQQLKGYCHKLAGVPWDGDDLFQETLLKAYKKVDQWSEMDNPKAYLFKIATNTWIDSCRKKKIQIDTYEDNFSVDQTSADFAVLEALEELVYKLPIRQASIVLLIEAFAFSIKETASMLEMTAGAVKAALHRARKTLKREYLHQHSTNQSDTDLINRFLSAFKNGEPQDIVAIYHELTSRGVSVKRTASMLGYYFEFKDPDGNILSVFQKREN